MTLQHVLKALTEAGLVGTKLIPSSFKPTVSVAAKFSKGGAVDLGNTIAIKDSQDAPLIEVDSEGSKDSSYVICMMDPDAKSRQEPIWAPFAHWVSSTPDLSVKPQLEYMGPAPPPGTGPHRYVLLAYAEANKGATQLTVSKEDRKNFPIEDFVSKNKLELVGANFFYAEDKSKE
ncbi:phosphatidylethanolamine-binding protein [Leucosporidium creatinivorum]|uniref:Phosphatidylethanolamine-binding protein n=1 Tax=Leucosporidium creatinivorum TaxID=106004 RepID=A0A1Y2EU18_9BASI|nr:phosphatidylethanolamine-binding protein [Leucosporidium creatinivorum]